MTHGKNLQTLVKRREHREFVSEHVEVLESGGKDRKALQVGAGAPHRLQRRRQFAQGRKGIVAEFQLLQGRRESVNFTDVVVTKVEGLDGRAKVVRVNSSEVVFAQIHVHNARIHDGDGS